jgi:hypothetical protein
MKKRRLQVSEDIIGEVQRLLAEPTLDWPWAAKFSASNLHRVRDTREGMFVIDMVKWIGRGRPPTRRQQDWLRDIYDRLRRDDEMEE